MLTPPTPARRRRRDDWHRSDGGVWLPGAADVPRVAGDPMRGAGMVRRGMGFGFEPAGCCCGEEGCSAPVCVESPDDMEWDLTFNCYSLWPYNPPAASAYFEADTFRLVLTDETPPVPAHSSHLFTFTGAGDIKDDEWVSDWTWYAFHETEIMVCGEELPSVWFGMRCITQYDYGTGKYIPTVRFMAIAWPSSSGGNFFSGIHWPTGGEYPVQCGDFDAIVCKPGTDGVLTDPYGCLYPSVACAYDRGCRIEGVHVG